MTIKKLRSLAIRFVPRSPFARSASLLVGGAAAGQAVVVLASPILTRLYSPEDFGVLAVFASILSILGIIASLRYQLAIPLPKSDVEAASVTVLSALAVTCMAILAAAIAIPLRQAISEGLNTPLLADYMWLLPLGLWLMGIYEVLNYWAIRKKTFGAIAQTKLTQSIGMVGVQIGGYTLGPVALLIGRIVGYAAGLFKLGTTARKDHNCFNEVRLHGIKTALTRYRAFPLVSTWSGLSSAGGSQLPPIMIAIILGPASAGLYALTHRVLSLPVGVISKSMGDVFYGEAIEAKSKGVLGNLVVDIYYKMVAASLPIAILLFVSARELFPVVFGENWARAGELASWMSFWIFFQFVTTPPGRVFLILERHSFALLFQVAFLLTTVISIVLGGLWFNNLVSIVVVLVFGNSFIYCFRFITILRLVGESARELWVPLIRNFPYSILCSLPTFYAIKALERTGFQLYLIFILVFISFFMSVAPSVRMLLKARRK